MKPKFFIYAIGCSRPELYFENKEKASSGLAEKAKELNSRWNTYGLVSSCGDDGLTDKFTIHTGGWDDQTIEWKIIPIPVY